MGMVYNAEWHLTQFIAVHFGVAMLKVAVFYVDFRTICTRDLNATLMLQVHMTFGIYLSEHGDSS